MAYIGNQVDTSFTSLIKQDLTGASGTSLTLTHAVANANDIALYINNVRQEPTSAYSTNGTAVSLTGSVGTSDDIYVIYLARAVQTTVPPDGSVSTGKLADGSVTTAKLQAGLTKNAIVNSFTPTTLTGSATGQTIALSGQYMDSASTVKLRKVSDNSDVGTNLSHTNDQSVTIATTSTFASVATNYKLVFQNPNSSEYIHSTIITIGLPDIVLFNSDDFGGSGDISSVTGGWTVSSYNHNSSGEAGATADRIKTRINGTAQTGYGIGYGIRSTNKVVIPAGYTKIEIIYRSVTSNNNFYLSETTLGMAQNNRTSSGHTDGLSSHNPTAGTKTITIDSTIADGTGYYFYFASYGGQYANVNQEITKIRIYAG